MRNDTQTEKNTVGKKVIIFTISSIFSLLIGVPFFVNRSVCQKQFKGTVMLTILID